MIEAVKHRREELREAGELLGVETVDRSGLVVTSEGAFVRTFRVSPVNPLLMSGEEREKAAGTLQRLISQLHADERIQVLVEGRPVNLAELVGESRREVEASAGPPPSRERPARDPLSLSRWRLHAALEESLRSHADSQAAVEVNHYVVVPFLPRQHVARAALAYARRGKLPTAPLERTVATHRRAVREHLGRVDALRSELEAEGMATELLDGEQIVQVVGREMKLIQRVHPPAAAPHPPADQQHREHQDQQGSGRAFEPDALEQRKRAAAPRGQASPHVDASGARYGRSRADGPCCRWGEMRSEA
jgi:hypothetical protein